MRPFAISLLCALFFVVSPVVAKQFPTQNDLFNDNLSQYDLQLEKLSALELLVSESGQTYEEMVVCYGNLAHVLVSDTDISDMLLSTNVPREEEWFMGIPGFLWGFCCSALGVMIMLFSFDDLEARNRETKSAVIGCAIGTLTWVALYVWFIYVTLEF